MDQLQHIVRCLHTISIIMEDRHSLGPENK
jgi:hypothetical protein